MQFPGFSAADFDTYRPEKWASNVFNRQRLEVKEKLEALARGLAPRLHVGDGTPLAFELSAEHPALWNQHRVERQQLSLSRNAEARLELDGLLTRQRSIASLIGDPSPLRQHVFLCVTIDRDRLEVALRLHADATVDISNLVRKSQDFFQRERLLEALRGLSGAFSIELDGHPPLSTEGIDDAALQTLLGALAQAQGWLSIRSTIDRLEAIAAGPALADRLGGLLDRLLPVLHYCAWRRDNDFVSVRQALRVHQQETKARGLAKGDRVRVTRGPFTGKVGLVQATDAKGGLKVLLGAVAVRLSGEDAVKL